MSSALKIDTLKYARKLTDAGMDPRQAEAIVEGLAEADVSDLATRADIGAVNGAIAGLKADIAALGAATKAGLAGAKAEIYRVMLVQAAAIVGLTVTLIKLLP